MLFPGTCLGSCSSAGARLSAGRSAIYSILGFGRTTERKSKAIWQQKLPLRVYAMVLAGERLFVNGVPDRIDADVALASFEGRLGGELYALSATDGTTLSTITRIPTRL